MIIQFSSFHLLPSLSLFQIFSFSGGLRILFVKLVFAIFKSMKKKASIVSELDSREQRHQWQNFFFFCDKVTIPLFGFARERQVNGPGAFLPTVLNNPLETKNLLWADCSTGTCLLGGDRRVYDTRVLIQIDHFDH